MKIRVQHFGPSRTAKQKQYGETMVGMIVVRYVGRERRSYAMCKWCKGKVVCDEKA